MKVSNISLKFALLIAFSLLMTLNVSSQMNEAERERLESFKTKFQSEQLEFQLELAKQARALNIPFRKKAWGNRMLVLGDIVNGTPMYDGSDNINAQITSAANDVKLNGFLNLDLSGAGINLGIWEAFDDDGNAMVRNTHFEFGGRAILQDGGGFSNHATHVAGTMIAAGLNPIFEGFSHAADLQCYDLDNDLTEMMNAALDPSPVLISNHSYGTVVGWDVDDDGNWIYIGDPGTTEDWRFGAYTTSAQDWDETAFNATHLLIVKSAGNNRDDPPAGTVLGGIQPDGGVNGFDCIPTYGTAKNIVTVGAIRDIPGGYTHPLDPIMSTFSGWGPVDDGRIKPDIVANGVALGSTGFQSDMAYDTLSGTSMSTPAVSGGAGLLYEHWDDVIGGIPRAVTMKGLLLESADEVGNNNGPDYSFGWGLMNVADAVEIITTEGFDGCQHYIEGTIEEDGTFDVNIESSGFEPLKVTLIWHDPASTETNSGDLNPTVRNLVNDLDLRIIKGSDTYFPWVMDPANPGNAATTGNNNRDNIEQVLILEPDEGEYTIRVTAPASLVDGPQQFTLWYIGNDATTDDRIISSVTINNSITYTADQNLTFGPDVTVTETGNARGFAGNSVKMVDGFHSIIGSSFHAKILPGGGCGGFTMGIKADNYPELAGGGTAEALEEMIIPEQAEEDTEPPATERLIAFPNPVSTKLNLKFSTVSDGNVTISVLNSVGKMVKLFKDDQFLKKGEYLEEFDIKELTTGTYFIVLKTKESKITKQVFVVK